MYMNMCILDTSMNISINVTSHGRYDVSNHHQLNILLNSLFRLTTKNSSQLRITRRKVITCHDAS